MKVSYFKDNGLNSGPSLTITHGDEPMIVCHGIDLVPFQRIERLLGLPSSEWVEGAFTLAEQEQAATDPKQVEYYSGRYAAKEAVAKALGTGFSDDVAWHDVEILRKETGAPYVQLSEGALAVSDGLGITRWFISISHSGGFAIASAIGVND